MGLNLRTIRIIECRDNEGLTIRFYDCFSFEP